MTVGGERRPLHDLGGGIVRLFRFLVDCYTARGGILVVDEIENGFHHSILPNLWRHLRVLAETLDVQLFATTHSQECVEAAVAAFEGDMEDLAIHGLHRVKGQGPVGAMCFTGETLAGARDLSLELR